MRRFTKIFLMIVGIITLIGCSLTPGGRAERSTQDAQSAVLTFSQFLTQTAQAATFTPTSTTTRIPATLTPTPTKTVLPTITQTRTSRPTLTALPPKTACLVIDQSPKGWTTMGRLWDFDARWTLRNVGFLDWDNEKVDFRYIRGEKLQKRTDVFVPPNDVEVQDILEIRIDMVAPEMPGEYSSIWGLMQDGKALCIFSVNIVVK